MLDAVDEVWTSLMRDIGLGQAHVFVPQKWLGPSAAAPGSRPRWTWTPRSSPPSRGKPRKQASAWLKKLRNLVGLTVSGVVVNEIDTAAHDHLVELAQFLARSTGIGG